MLFWLFLFSVYGQMFHRCKCFGICSLIVDELPIRFASRKLVLNQAPITDPPCDGTKIFRV